LIQIKVLNCGALNVGSLTAKSISEFVRARRCGHGGVAPPFSRTVDRTQAESRGKKSSTDFFASPFACRAPSGNCRPRRTRLRRSRAGAVRLAAALCLQIDALITIDFGRALWADGTRRASDCTDPCNHGGLDCWKPRHPIVTESRLSSQRMLGHHGRLGAAEAAIARRYFVVHNRGAPGGVRMGVKFSGAFDDCVPGNRYREGHEALSDL
jgi:hypothetical protein